MIKGKNMREIKFRAWDRHRKKFCDWREACAIIENEDTQMRLGIIKLNNDELSSYTFQQYTGLKDKNGKEIYEGDYDQDYNVVTWCEKRMGWAMSVYDFPTQEYIFCNCYSCEGNFEITELEDIEIIGNIYENHHYD